MPLQLALLLLQLQSTVRQLWTDTSRAPGLSMLLWRSLGCEIASQLSSCAVQGAGLVQLLLLLELLLVLVMLLLLGDCKLRRSMLWNRLGDLQELQKRLICCLQATGCMLNLQTYVGLLGGCLWYR